MLPGIRASEQFIGTNSQIDLPGFDRVELDYSGSIKPAAQYPIPRLPTVCAHTCIVTVHVNAGGRDVDEL